MIVVAETGSIPAGVIDPRRVAALRATGLICDQVFPGLDRLTGIATRMLPAPIALVSLVDTDRQWFASHLGLPERWATARQTPLTHSFCQYVVDAQQPVIIADARADPLWCTNLAIPELGVIAYAGYPLRAPGGEVLGSFCAADTRPRRWDARDLRFLADMAAVAADEVATVLRAGQLAEKQHDADRQRAFLDALLDSLDAGVVACDPSGRIVLMNRALRQMTDVAPGSSPEESVARFIVLHPSGSAFAPDELPLARALAGERVRDDDHLLIGPDQRRATVRAHAQAIIGPRGDVLGAVAAVHDVTERRRADRFRDAALAVHDACATAAPVEAAPAIVRAVAGALEWAHAELWLADQLDDLLRPVATWTEPGHRVDDSVPPVIERGHGLAGAVWHTGRPVCIPDLTGNPAPLSPETVAAGRWGAALGVPVHGSEHPIGALVMFAAHPQPTDPTIITMVAGIANQISELLQRHRADDLDRQLARSKDEYLALVGHSLRTPLTSITAITDLLADTDGVTTLAQVADLHEALRRNTTKLQVVVDDLLDLAALDSGYLPMATGPVDLAALVRDSVAAVRTTAAAQRIALHTATPDHLVVDGSAARLRQLIDAVVDNALRYSRSGGRVTTALTASGGVAELVVTDTRIGIDPGERDEVFRRFFRSRQVQHSSIPGTGLGLALCRTITELHHGTITLTTPPDGHPGTTVTIRLPAGRRRKR
ncbi:hypothetical protein Aph02nite_45550 [Actinoplanes philippinensis]|nr:hypothetical protein Aph02nite_45550 [Actinoplanes philippinensis]